MKNNLMTLFCSGLLLLGTGACKKKCTDTTTNLEISAHAKSLMPYTVSNKLTFKLDILNMSKTYTGMPYPLSDIPFEDLNIKEFVEKDADGCKTTYTNKRIDYFFVDANQDGGIAAGLVHLDLKNEYLWVGYGDYIYITAVSNLGPPYEYPSIVIQGKTYTNVSYFESDFDGDFNQGCLYNAEYGILRLDISSDPSDSAYLDLVKKE